MVYRFCFDGHHTLSIINFAKFASELKSVRYLGVEWVEKDRKGFVEVMCSKKDYEELFCWLRKDNLYLKITTVKEKK